DQAGALAGYGPGMHQECVQDGQRRERGPHPRAAHAPAQPRDPQALHSRRSIFGAMPDHDADLRVCHLGVVDYRAALDLQVRLRAAREAGGPPATLLLLEHPPVYTRGRRSDPGELPMGERWYRMQGIEIVPTARGGNRTYHGPGQLVGYPIMRISDVVAYLRTMERAIVASLSDAGGGGGPRDGLSGVWV